MAIIGFLVSVGSAFGYDWINTERVALIISGCVALSAYVLGEGIADSAKDRGNK